MDHRILFLQFESASDAARFRDEVTDLFRRHVTWLKTCESMYTWQLNNPSGLTPPMIDHAATAGFRWSEDDALVWVDDDLDPDLSMYSVGELAVVSHRACQRFGQDGLSALAELRGCTTRVFWDPDPLPMKLRVTLGSDAAEKALLACAAEEDFPSVTEGDEILTREAPDGQDVEVVFVRWQRNYHLAEPSALDALLYSVACHGEVAVQLTVGDKAPDTWTDLHSQVVQVMGNLLRSAERLDGEAPAVGLKFATAIAGEAITMEQLTRSAPETLSVDRIAELRAAAHALDRSGWKLAAMNPMDREQLQESLAAHEQWVAGLEDELHWTTPVWAFGTGVQIAFHDRSAQGQAYLDHRDLRSASFAGRELSHVSLVESSVDGVDFSRATLRHAQATDLHGVNARFDGANLDHADFSRSRLSGASFRDAQCVGTKFDECDVAGCDFRGAVLSDEWKSLRPRVVQHLKYGEGVILRELEGDKLEIEFDSAGSKILLRRFIRELG